KQWHFFSIDTRHFLALAQGVTVDSVVPKNPRESRIYEWNGEQFVLFQTLDGTWGYNWASKSFAGEHYLAYADHLGGSRILKWQGERFEAVQILPDPGGRAFVFFEDHGALWMLYANLMGSTVLYEMNAERFIERQTLGGPGGRELCLIDGALGKYLVRVCFITGTPRDPHTALTSQIYQWSGSSFELADEFPTAGGTDATAFEANGVRYLVVSNSLTEEVRFRAESVLYRFNG
ncbi:hypothetical protein, partial [uncultured Caballeronia sp.]|uniref:hypothetical protein n=1 Tax=uncultured Caballeronia sp. TaxID=1827198 RepID=UPI0035CA4946